MTASKKVQLSLIESRQCAFHRAIDVPCALALSPPKGGSKREFLHLALPFIPSLQVIVDASNMVCGLKFEHSKSQHKDDKPSLKWAWSLSRDLFNFWKISDNISKTVQDSLIITVCTVVQDCCKGRSNKYRKWNFWGSCRPETP